MRKIRKKILLPVCAAVFAAGYLALCQPLTVRQYTIWSEKVTSPVRLAVIADLHSTYYGDDQQQLLSVLRQEQPDAVLLVGDTADDEVPHDGAACLLSVIGTEFPCYLVFGNHEFWAEDFPDIQKMVQDSGVHLLRGESCLLQVGDTTIQLAGVDDPDGFADPAAWQAHLRETASGLQEGVATILLSHRPEQIAAYDTGEFDLVVAGHAHGGQVRIPYLLNGLYAPNQGWFPAYAGGVYPLEQTTLVVSRGLCRNELPRICNPPELLMITMAPAGIGEEGKEQ